MSKEGKIPLLAALLGIIAAITMMAGVINASSANYNEIRTVKGTISYIDIEGGFWGILGDDGEKYDPVRLPTELRKTGLRVKFQLIILENYISFRMWGMQVSILDYKILN